MARAPDFDLAAELAKPSFTPAHRDAPALVELVVTGNDPAATHAAAALAGLGDAGRAAVQARICDDDGGRARLAGVLGLLARKGDATARAGLLAAIGDAAPRVRRAAIGALGKLGGDDATSAVLARWDAVDVTPDERRTLAEALGKLGGEAALARLHALVPGDDAELARRRDRALLMAERTGKRGEDSTVRVDVAPPAPVAMRLACKAGLAGMLVDELRALLIEARAVDDAGDAVELALATPWSTLFASRLWLGAGIRLPRSPGELAASITSALIAPATRRLLTALTRGPIRWRLDLPAGKQRSVVWRVARDVGAAAPELLNDPTATTWDVVVGETTIELRPRRIADPRFQYRVAEVPAASHPTVAAALARLGEARPDDRVWDPFVGSALELVERAKLGPFRWLVGTDLAKPALAAAHANIDAAGVRATLEHGDARAAIGERDVDLVITNPPLGSRVQLDAGALLVELLPVIARRLVPRGRLVWITPAPKLTTPAAERLGLRRVHATRIDLGGVRGRLERWDAPAT